MIKKLNIWNKKEISELKIKKIEKINQSKYLGLILNTRGSLLINKQ